MAAIQSVDVGRNPHVSAGPAPIRLQNRHALACGPLQPGEKPHAHAWRFCSHTMQPQKAYVRITVHDYFGIDNEAVWAGVERDHSRREDGSEKLFLPRAVSFDQRPIPARVAL